MSVNRSLLEFKKYEFAFEVFVQITIQLIMLMLNYTKTGTQTGLQAVFKTDAEYSWIDPTTFLTLSILWSFSSSVFTYLKMAQLEKDDFLPMKGKIIIAIRVLISSIIRIMTFFFYFAPFLGLMNLLAHWKADQIKYSDVQMQNSTFEYWSASQNETYIIPFSKLHYYPGEFFWIF